MSGLVLIVDDDEALSENLAEIVQELGVRAVIAPDRQSALAQAAAHDFDVALIDVRLPDGDGLSLLGPLRERSPHLQAVMVTGNASVEGAMAAVRGAAFAYVVKPVSPPELLETTRRALDQAALYRERERLRRELEGSEQRHRELVESVPAFVLALDEAGRLTTWNSELERVTGYQRAEMLGNDGRRFVGDDGRPDRPAAQGGRQAQGPLAPRRGEGARRPEHHLRGRHRRHRRGRDPAPRAPLRAAGGRRDAGGRAGARGAQPAQLRGAAARRCSSAASTAATSRRRSCRSPTSSRARSTASIAWCASSWRSRSRGRSSPVRSTSATCSRRSPG